jgi:hypothetical protein
MSAEVAARKQTGWRVVSVPPDVCNTPMGSSIVAVPYPVIAKLEDCVSEASSVRANGHPVVVFSKTQVPMTIGDSAGSATGVKSGTVEGKCWPLKHSGTVRAEKHYIVRHNDLFGMNGS